MRSLKAAIALASMTALAGCSSEYDSSEVTINKEHWKYAAEFVENESGDPITGTVVFKNDEKVFKAIEIVGGKATGEWVEYRDDGSVELSTSLKEGEQVGLTNRYCQGESKDQIRESQDYSGDTIKTSVYDCASGLMIEESTRLKKGIGYVGVKKNWNIVAGKQIPSSVENYNTEGKQDGVSESYFDDGRLHISKTYKNGEQEGPYKEYVKYQDESVRLKTDGVYKGYSMVEGKSFKTDTRYPEGTLEEHIIPLWDGGQAILRYNDDEVRTSWNEGEASASERMIMTKVLDNKNPRQTDIDNIAYLVKTTKVDLNKVYGKGRYMFQNGNHLITAMGEGYYDALVGMGLDPQGTDFDGTTRLMMCLESDNCSFDHMMRLANDSLAADVKSKHVFGETAASFFCKRLDRIRNEKKYDLFAVLVKMDDVNKANNAGQTPLHQCMQQKDLTAAKMLVATGADLTAKNHGGFTPLHMAFVQQNGSRVNISWTPDKVKTVGELAKGSSFSFNEPIPVFEKSLKAIFLENGDAASAQAAEAYN